MKIHPSFLLTLTLLAGCTSRLIGGDDNDASGSNETTGDPSTTVDTLSTTTEDPSTTIDTLSTTDPSTTDPSTSTPTTFVPESDEWWSDPCDPFAQDCPEGEKCVPYASSGGTWDAQKCVPIMGTQAPGEPCWYGGAVDATDNCDATSMCWDVDEEGNGTCTPFCTGTPDNPMCPPMSSCLISGDGSLTLCISNCDPLLQDCNDGLACFWDGVLFSCIFTTEDIPTGDPCGYINDCAEGNICLDAAAFPSCGGPACCSSFCDTELGPAQCEGVLPGTECVAFFEMPVVGYENVGICIVPQP